MESYVDSLLEYLKQFIGMKSDDLFIKFNVNANGKSRNYLLSQALIGSFNGIKMAKIEIEKYNLNIKTIQLKENGYPQESMSFPAIKYKKIIHENWDNSEFKNYLSNPFIFFIYKYKNGFNFLERVMKWEIPISDLNGNVRDVWEDTKNKIMNGNVIREIKNNKFITCFLAERETTICHVRPHGKNHNDWFELPVMDKISGYMRAPKQSFQINHEYLKKIVENN